MEKDYCVYCHTNNINGKRYIGITCQKPERRWKNGKGYINNNYFYRAIQKYGWHNFSHNVLYTDLNKEDAERIEIELIAKYGTINPNRGYNIEKGGNGTEKFTPEIKKKDQRCFDRTFLFRGNKKKNKKFQDWETDREAWGKDDAGTG